MKEAYKRLMFLKPLNTNMINAAECYGAAAQRAADYFESLRQQIVHKPYVQTLTRNLSNVL
jgi:hypothetical protein